MEANRHAVRRPAHDALSAARKALESGRAGTEAPAPHWVRVAGWVREARTGSQAGLAHAREDVAAYEHLLQAVADSERRYAAAEEYIRRETADRPAAACRLAGAGAILTDVRSKVEIAGNDWARLAAEAERVATTADEALQMAQEDVRLAETAAGAIASAQSGISSADRYYAHGVRADVGSAQMLLSQAVASLSDKVYEDAIELALHARSHAEDAVAQAQARVAVVEAALERQRREEERRREEEERRQALFNSLSSSGSSSSSSPSSRGSGSSSSSFSSGSSSSSYKSGTSQSSW